MIHGADVSRDGCYGVVGHEIDCFFADESSKEKCEADVAAAGKGMVSTDSGNCAKRLASAACYGPNHKLDCAFNTGITETECQGTWMIEYNAKSHPDYAGNTCGDQMEAAMAGGDDAGHGGGDHGDHGDADHGSAVEDHMTGAHKGGCYEEGVKMDCVFAGEFDSFGDDALKKEMCEAMGAEGTHSWYDVSSSCEKRMDAAGCYTGQSDITDADGNVIHPKHTVYCVYARYYGKDHPDQLVANNVGKDVLHAAPLDTKAKCDAVGGSWNYESPACKARLEEHDASVSGCYSGMVPENQADYHRMTCKKEGPHISAATCPTGPGGAGWYEESTSCGAADPDKLAAYECVEVRRRPAPARLPLRPVPASDHRAYAMHARPHRRARAATTAWVTRASARRGPTRSSSTARRSGRVATTARARATTQRGRATGPRPPA